MMTMSKLFEYLAKLAYKKALINSKMNLWEVDMSEAINIQRRIPVSIYRKVENYRKREIKTPKLYGIMAVKITDLDKLETLSYEDWQEIFMVDGKEELLEDLLKTMKYEYEYLTGVKFDVVEARLQSKKETTDE